MVEYRRDEYLISTDRARLDVEFIVAHPDLQSLRIFLLATRDAHELYRRHGGFQELLEPEWLMARRQT